MSFIQAQHQVVLSLLAHRHSAGGQGDGVGQQHPGDGLVQRGMDPDNGRVIVRLPGPDHPHHSQVGPDDLPHQPDAVYHISAQPLEQSPLRLGPAAQGRHAERVDRPGDDHAEQADLQRDFSVQDQPQQEQKDTHDHGGSSFLSHTHSVNVKIFSHTAQKTSYKIYFTMYAEIKSIKTGNLPGKDEKSRQLACIISQTCSAPPGLPG